jgi:hypothetical protein
MISACLRRFVAASFAAQAISFNCLPRSRAASAARITSRRGLSRSRLKKYARPFASCAIADTNEEPWHATECRNGQPAGADLRGNRAIVVVVPKVAGKAVRHSKVGSLGGLQESEGQSGSGHGDRTFRSLPRTQRKVFARPPSVGRCAGAGGAISYN